MKDNEFLEKVVQLFMKYGPKSFTMDDIAREFRVSKKTLYQEYKNKEALLEDVLVFHQNMIAENFKNMQEKVENPITKMYCRDKEIENIMDNDSLFIKQLIKYYPDIFEKHMIVFSEKISELIYQNIIAGREMGYYREEFDAKLYAKFLFHLMISYHNAPYMGIENMRKADYSNLVLDFYLNAITTEKGKEFLENNNIIN